MARMSGVIKLRTLDSDSVYKPTHDLRLNSILPDGGGRGVELGDGVLGDDLPEAVVVGVERRALQ